MQLREAIKDFELAIAAEGVSKATLTWYRSLLKTFLQYCGDAELETFTNKAMRLFIVWAREQFSEDTAHGHIRVQHRFWKWCAEEYKIDSPMRNIPYPDAPKKKAPKAADLGDISRLFEVIDTSTAEGKRDYAILAFLSDTGCRAGGLVTLEMANLDMAARRAIVNEKGNKTRSLPFTDFTKKALQAWFEAKPATKYTFVNLRTYEPLTVNGLAQVLKRLRKRAGVVGRTNPHAFRHAFAREYLKGGGDLATLSRIMGHADVATTAAHYAIFTQDELAAKHEQLSPMTKIRRSLDRRGEEV